VGQRADASLCHGLTGLAEVLWTGGRILSKPRHQALAVAATRELARTGPGGTGPRARPPAPQSLRLLAAAAPRQRAHAVGPAAGGS
jgi:hypothetical protein